MDQGRWKQIEDLYHAAMEQEPASRCAFVAEACEGDDVLRREVESLLKADSVEALIDGSAMDAAAQLLDNDNPLPAGAQLGPYRIEELLGSGGMGQVYRARDMRLGRIVALKISKEEFGERFDQEARVIAGLNHPHICHLYDVGPNYLVMELIEGRPLQGRLPVATAMEYASQILDALAVAHSKGVVHRDLKPSNILVAKQGIKLLDFGLAKRVTPLGEQDATLTAALTRPGMILGTLQYMSPEQLQGKEADVRSDLFSFGCVLYEMLTGRRAFEGENPASVIAAVVEREPLPLEVSPPLDRVVMRCLAKDLDRRFQTAIDLKAALIWAMEQQPVATRSQRWSLTVAAGLVLGLAVGWALFHFRASARDERIVHFQIVPPKGARPAPWGLSVSPDGRYVTYSSLLGGKQALWLHPLDGAAERLLTDNATARFPFWSPDGRSIGWAADSKLWRLDLAGGTPVALCDQEPLRPAVWSHDDRILFGSLRGLMQVSPSGGSPAPLTTLDASLGELQHGRPELLPHGRFLHLVLSSKPGNSGIYEVSFSNPSQRVRIMGAEDQVRYASTPDGKHYLLMKRQQKLVAQEFNLQRLELVGEPYTIAELGPGGAPSGGPPVLSAEVSPAGVLLYMKNPNVSGRLVWLDRAGQQLATVSDQPYPDFRLSPDGRLVALTQFASGGRSALWMIDMERGIRTRLTPTSGVAQSSGYPIWSPDGRTVMFSQTGVLMRRDISSSGDELPITEAGRLRNPSDWSRDGRFILFSEGNTETNQDLWVLRVTPSGKPVDGERPKPYLRGPFNELAGRFSPEPNPRWVAYQSDETGQDEIFIASFPEPRQKVQVSSGGGHSPQWATNGRELFYVSADDKLTVVGLKMTAATIEPSRPHGLFSLDGLSSTYDVAPDGKRFLVNQGVRDLAPPEVIMNWPALLKRRPVQ
jgi:Tol biopolymer transport system component/predicted Ser/Thr protein kinase